MLFLNHPVVKIVLPNKTRRLSGRLRLKKNDKLRWEKSFVKLIESYIGKKY